MEQKIWFITGASSGFGEVMAKYLIEAGHIVIITARRKNLLEQIKKMAPDRVEVFQMDVTNTSQIKEVCIKTLSKYGRIDYLFNNAGYGMVGAIEESSDEDNRKQFETIFFGAVNVIKAFLPQFRKQKYGGIINISSSVGQFSMPGFGIYSASKFALEGMSEALAAEMSNFGVKVLIVEPGVFNTGFAGSAFHYTKAMDEYKETVGGIREFVEKAGKEKLGSNPQKMPIAILKAIESENTPLRLQLGKDAVDTIKIHSEKLLKDMKIWEEISNDMI
ncbi:MAG: SDR family NAD(P)-dependent oxidoreductase [Marinifilaceae bacterium]|nr:SDR family NAD(P)-dependent oxidoreductase [Marinifilaceae bacterium]